METFDILIGRKILDINILNEGDFLEVLTDIGLFEWRADGDCCSTTYIESMPPKEEIIGEIVIGAKDIDMDNKSTSDNDCCMQYYSSTLITKKGEFSIEYRNESNGYYGGYLTLMKSPIQ